MSEAVNRRATEVMETAAGLGGEFGALRSRVLELVAHGGNPSCPKDEARFGELALDIFRFQQRHNPIYRRYCEALGMPEPGHWSEIPALPTSAFKRGRIACFPPEHTVATFHTSGTTEGETGRHEFPTLDLYEAVAVPNWREAFGATPAGGLKELPGGGGAPPMFVLTPSPADAPHSSLVAMMGMLRESDAGSGGGYFVDRDGQLRTDELIAALDPFNSATAPPVVLMGTAFAFVYFLDALDARGVRFLLNPESRLMETGGFKGRTREVPRSEFYARLSVAFGMPEHRIVNEYGMTELSSQFYDLSLVQGGSTTFKKMPAWTRVEAINPATNIAVPDGERGMLKIVDLANLHSVAVIQTEDVGVCRGDTFEIHGRAATAAPRGCSLAVEAAMGASG